MSLLSERAVQASLHIGCWSGSSHDREVTEEVAERNKADVNDAGRYSKKLIATKFLSRVASNANMARRTHRLLTLPWDDNGARILSTTGYVAYTEQMRLKRHAFEASVHEFCEGLPQYIEEAKQRLGAMFDRNDYEKVEAIKNKFYLDVEISPVPEAGDFRAELSNANVKAIVKDIERRTEARLDAAVRDVFQRIADVTGRMADRLRSYKPGVEGERPENTFKDSLVYNITELAELLPSLNITQDARLDALQQRMLKDLVEYSPGELRDSERARKQTADKAEKLFKKVSGYLK